jgi:DUF4097 and DUF4098 domain-containing protein YvlB
MERRALLASVAAGSTAVVAGCVGGLFGSTVEESRELSFDAPADGRVGVVTANGDVSVSTHSGTDVAVAAVVSAPSESRVEDVTVTGEREGGDLRVGWRVDGSENRVGVDFDVRVPEETAVASVETENGDVSVRGVGGVGRAQSENGDVTIADAGPLGGVSTENGDIDADVLAPLPGDVTVSSENGDVSADVSPDVNASVTAVTENGDVDVGDGLALADASVSESRVAGRLGDGEHVLTVETANGDVTLDAG